MKKPFLILYLVVTSYIIISCKENKDEFYIYAKVENASAYSNVVEVKLMGYDSSSDSYIEFARGEWKGNGFTIVLPKTINPNCLATSIGGDELPTTINNLPSTLTIIGNKNVKVCDAYFWGYDKDDNRVARFSPYDKTYPFEEGIPYFTYADSDITISGYIKEVVPAAYWGVVDDPTLYEWKKITTYSIEWKKGWNFWRYSDSQSSPKAGIMTEEWSTTPNNKIKWYGSTNY